MWIVWCVGGFEAVTHSASSVSGKSALYNTDFRSWLKFQTSRLLLETANVKFGETQSWRFEWCTLQVTLTSSFARGMGISYLFQFWLLRSICTLIIIILEWFEYKMMVCNVVCYVRYCIKIIVILQWPPYASRAMQKAKQKASSAPAVLGRECSVRLRHRQKRRNVLIVELPPLCHSP